MDTETFYNPAGQVRMPEAQELANIEATKGQNTRIVREKELKRLAETGLSDEERKYIEIQTVLKEKYPDAFSEIIDSKGRKVSISGGQEGQNFFVFSQLGVVEGSASGQPVRVDDINVEGVLDTIKNKAPDFGQKNLGGWEGVPTEHVFKLGSKNRELKGSGYSSLRLLDLNSQGERNFLHSTLVQEQSRGERRRLQDKAPSASVQTIISEL